MILELLLAAVASPSFDCKRARSMVETMICASREMSALDSEQARLYRLAAAGSAAQRKRTLARQREFLDERDSCDRHSGEALSDCIRTSYLGEIADLRRLYAPGAEYDQLSESPLRYLCDEGYPDAYVTRFRFTPAQAYITIPDINEGQPLLASTDEPQRLVGRASNGMILEPGEEILRLNARVCRLAQPVAADAQGGAAKALALTANGLAPGITFGLGKEQTVRLASSVLGPPTKSSHIECPAGAMDFVSFGDLDLLFEDGRFTGWSLHGPTPALRTPAGLGIGSPRSALADVPISEDEGMGAGFDLGDFGGYLDEAGSRVASLAAGSICEFG